MSPCRADRFQVSTTQSKETLLNTKAYTVEPASIRSAVSSTSIEDTQDAPPYHFSAFWLRFSEDTPLSLLKNVSKVSG